MRTAKFLSLVLLFVFSFQFKSSFAGHSIGAWTGQGTTNILVSYFDLGNRQTFVQVTNTSSTMSAVLHVQIFSDAFNCEDRDFSDTLTPNETHVYDIRNLQTADGSPVNFAIPDGSHGFVVISAGNGMGGSLSELVGNFRIVDNSGYEYRVNSAANASNFPLSPRQDRKARFTDDWGANQADIVGANFELQTQLPDGSNDVTVQLTDPAELFIFDDEETGTSCGEVIMGCDEIPGDDDSGEGDGVDLPVFTGDFINQGINDVFPNSRGGGVLCSGDFNTDGYVRVRISTVDSGNIGFETLIGFVGLNDGSGRGSMDRFKHSGIQFF